MKMIRQSHEIWGETPSDLTEQFRWIERAGRVCWQSGGKITPESYIKFIDMIIGKGHTSVLEHSNIIHPIHYNCPYSRGGFPQVSSNIRALHEWFQCNSLSDVTRIIRNATCNQYEACTPQSLKRITVEFITNRAVTHELVRHRVASFSMASQRYIRYDNGLSFIEPHYWPVIADSARIQFVEGLLDAEAFYIAMREEGLSPQDARHVLPNATATKLIMTAYLPDWWKIFDLRCSSAADPQMRDLMIPLREEFKQRGWTI